MLGIRVLTNLGILSPVDNCVGKMDGQCGWISFGLTAKDPQRPLALWLERATTFDQWTKG